MVVLPGAQRLSWGRASNVAFTASAAAAEDSLLTRQVFIETKTATDEFFSWRGQNSRRTTT